METTSEQKKIVLGPLLDEDALFLQAIIKMCDPRIVLEFGHLWGNSARAMLDALHPEATLFSFDNTKTLAEVTARTSDPRLVFYPLSQELFAPPGKPIDFVFLDASHELERNQKTFERLEPLMRSKGIIAVHDTGTWPSNVFNAKGGMERNGRYVHCPEELTFVDWVKVNYPEWEQIHFHSDTAVRHGITLLQKYTKLDE